jgi:recombination associated protein RdgC
MFKNAIFYRLTDDVDLHSLQGKLERFASRNPGDSEVKTQGFVAPDGNRPYSLFQPPGVPGKTAYFIRMKTVERVLPSSVVKDEVAAVVKNLEEKEQRKVGKKERAQIKDETIFRLLPKAFLKSSYTEAFIDYANKLVVANAASFNKAEDLLSLLRKALGTLPVTLVETTMPVVSVMTQWMSTGNSLPFACEFEGQYVLRDGESTVKKSRFKAYAPEELSELLDQGHQVTALSLNWDDELSFMLSDDLRVKGIKDLQGSSRETEGDDPFKADCLLTHGLLLRLFNTLLEAFGGEL